MRLPNSRHRLLPAAAALLCGAALVGGAAPHPPPLGPNTTTPATLRTHATTQSISIEWDLAGDADHDATCRVRYRVCGTRGWKPALPLFRVDFYGYYGTTKADRAYNMFAGSLMFLQPGKSYEVALDLEDPDGGRERRLLAVPTRPEPRLARGARTRHVVPGDGGGDGSKERPFQGLAAAQAAAMPGDVFLLHRGEYGHAMLNAPGAPGRYLAWKAAGDGEALFRSVEVAASHVWLERLHFRAAERDTGLRVAGAPEDVVVRGCDFAGYRSSVVLSKNARDWTITDNVVVGINKPGASDLEGEGIDLFQSSGHVVAYNRVSHVQAGIHYPKRDCDIYGNDIFDTSDDGLEPDYGYANIRMWGNRISNVQNNSLSFQPQNCGPWYLLRNQVIGGYYTFKWRVQDRFVLAHNTFVNWGPPDPRAQQILTSLSRNNLFIMIGSAAPIWASFNYKEDDPNIVRMIGPESYRPNWMTDVDNDGFDWGEAPVPFRWSEREFRDLPSFAAAIGIERHGIRVRKEEIFAEQRLPAKRAHVEPLLLTLKPGSNAVDAGALLPNLNDDFAGKAPDLGCHELGKPLAQYGPRGSVKQ